MGHPTADEIKADIDRLFRDTSVSQGQTGDDLRDIREHIDTLLETLSEGDD